MKFSACGRAWHCVGVGRSGGENAIKKRHYFINIPYQKGGIKRYIIFLISFEGEQPVK